MGGSVEQKRTKFNKTKEEQKIPLSFANSPVVIAFQTYSQELDLKHEKYERIVKHSRDITIASKRIIFSVHALIRSSKIEEDAAKIKESLNAVKTSFFKHIAQELLNEDPYQYIRAYIYGLQEYIEAVTFLYFIEKGNLCDFQEIGEELIFSDDASTSSTGKRKVLVPLLDYILGLQDLTGELMRHCISSFGCNQKEGGYTACNFVKQLYTGLLLLSNLHNKEFYKKITVARQSLEKMEIACYSSRIRGSEVRPSCEGDPEEAQTFYE